MSYLKLETCQMLEKLGCTSDSEMWWAKDSGEFELKQYGDLTATIDDGENSWMWITEAMSKGHAYPAFTWDDICTRENCIKIWGNIFTYEPHDLLDMKLNGEDWEAELLRHLRQAPYKKIEVISDGNTWKVKS